MQVTISSKQPTVITIPVQTSPVITSQTYNNLALGQLNNVNIGSANDGDVLMLHGSVWEAQPLDGGTFN